LVVDVCGHVLAVVVHSAGVQDFHGARLVLQKLGQRLWQRLSKLLADSIYKGDKYLANWIQDTFGWELEVVERQPGTKGFQIIPKRWVVERTFAWLGRNRRLSKEYDLLPETSETWIYIAMSALLVRRLAINK
jgi:putative transposase